MKFLKMFRDWEYVEEYSARDVIYSERDPADAMYVILSGEIELTLHGESLGIEKTGDVIGEMAMIKSATRSATATALTDVKLARLDHEQFKKFFRENSDFSIHVMAALANRLRAVDRYITAQFERLK